MSAPATAGVAAESQMLSAPQQVLELLARQARRVPWAIAMCALFFAAMMAPHAHSLLVGAWTLAVVGTQVLRWAVLTRLPTMQRTVQWRLRLAGLLGGLNGLVLAMAVPFFWVLPDLPRAVISLLLAGLSTGSVATTAGHPLVYRSFALPMMCALMAGWALAPPTGNEGSWLHGLMALLALLYLLILLALARDTHLAHGQSIAAHNNQIVLNEQLRLALASAQDANAAKTRFLAAASHDLRQPLHTLTLFCAALRTHDLPQASKEVLRHMDGALHALRSQLMALLDVSKLDAGVVTANIRPVRLVPLFERLTQELRPQAQVRGLTLLSQCQVEPDVCVQADEVLLERILRNLLDNALKYCDAGTVWLAARTDGERMTVSVRDTGRGIPPEHHDRVFEEFFQVDNPERDRSRGLGLGLSIVQRLARLLDAQLVLRSELGVGTVVSVSLPMATAPATEETEGPASPTAPVVFHALVLDDEEGVRAAMKALLESLGCRVTLAGNTDEAVRLAAGDLPDIVLADFRLRGAESGIKAIRKLRQQHPGLPALLISGDTAQERLREAHDAGLTLLHKPLGVETLLSCVVQAIEDAPGRLAETP